MTDPSWYFERLDNADFSPTRHVGGGWNPAEQHIAPALGLLVHLVEEDRDRRRGNDLVIARLSYDILGVLPMAPFTVQLEVVRPGKTIELVEARIFHSGRTAVVLRAWLLVVSDTSEFSGSPLAAIPGPENVPNWALSNVWPGGFVHSVQIRRAEQVPGQCLFWANTDISLLKDNVASATARLMGLVDVANGVTPRAPPNRVAFPNLDLTAHLIRAPRGSWIGFETTVSFSANGIGLTHSVIHDRDGPVGVVSQCLTVRPAQGAGSA